MSIFGSSSLPLMLAGQRDVQRPHSVQLYVSKRSFHVNSVISPTPNVSLIDLVPIDGTLGSRGGAAPAREGRNLDHFCLQVEPFDGEAIISHLRQHGCEPGPIESRYGAKGQGPSIYVPDPEGNMVELKGPPWET